MESHTRRLSMLYSAAVGMLRKLLEKKLIDNSSSLATQLNNTQKQTFKKLSTQCLSLDI